MDKRKQFQISFVLSRVLNSGIIMSIEKNEKEIKGLEKFIGKATGLPYVSVFNSYTGALHGALYGQDLVHGTSTHLPDITEQEDNFLAWLGITSVGGNEDNVPFQRIRVNWDNIHNFESLMEEHSTLLLDLTDLGFGPCGIIATNQELIWKKSERLKIFGAFDLRTMWTQEESNYELQPGVQFNYRISPLVAACVKLSLLRRGEHNED
ncbi:degT/DnrJ/EryC1/StrS aminotransferase (plasmid) [Pseudalkalibacillus hwajinpoensis]|uniref:degT/DnrJ/EryC1/StrS aminotransferase n=1 Tax=Guptibacillus hwajinpoensis TaxID=208199 RepID=UPI00325BC25F